MVQHRLAVCESFNSVYIVLNKSNHFISKVFIGNNGHRKHGYEIKKKNVLMILNYGENTQNSFSTIPYQTEMKIKSPYKSYFI